MPTLIRTPDEATFESLVSHRRDRGQDRFDEVWNGTYHLMPDPSVPHQLMVTQLLVALVAVLDAQNGDLVIPGGNVTDREDDWTTDYRCPDVTVLRAGGTAENRDTHILGGPDLAIEIVSPGDFTREKIGFYGQVGTRELLIIERQPLTIELWRLGRGGSNANSLQCVASVTGSDRGDAPSSSPVTTESVPIRWSLCRDEVTGVASLRLEATDGSDHAWTV